VSNPFIFRPQQIIILADGPYLDHKAFADAVLQSRYTAILGVNVAGLKHNTDAWCHYDDCFREETAHNYGLTHYNKRGVDLGPQFWRNFMKEQRKNGRVYKNPLLTLPLVLEWALVTFPGAPVHLFGVDHEGEGLSQVTYKESHWATERRLLAEFLPQYADRVHQHGKAKLPL
jgi:hypothetical protein